MRRFFIKLFIIAFAIGIILGLSYPQKQVISGKDHALKVTVQVHTYFWFVTTFRVIERNIGDQPIYISNTPTDIVLKHQGQSTYIPGGANDIPAIFTVLSPKEPRISKLYFKCLYHTKYDLSKEMDWGKDSTSIQKFVLRGTILK